MSGVQLGAWDWEYISALYVCIYTQQVICFLFRSSDCILFVPLSPSFLLTKLT
uniref:Uncharacterized protein n=1 Tax=Oryza brachyantha TaxID=4533 RepID=J3L3G1_ORYBR